jgi:hypothetical protein
MNKEKAVNYFAKEINEAIERNVKNSCWELMQKNNFKKKSDNNYVSCIIVSGHENPKYHINKKHSAFIKEQIQEFNKLWFLSENKGDYESEEDYFSKLKRLKILKDDFENYKSHFNAFINSVHCKIETEITLNKNDIVSIMSRLEIDNDEKDVFKKTYKLQEFLDYMNIDSFNYIDSIGKKVCNGIL